MNNKTILCGIDFSAGSHAAAERAAQLASAAASALVLLHVYQVPVRAFLAGAPTVMHAITSLSAAGHDNLLRLAAELEATHALHPDIRTIEGVPWKQIVRVAQELGAELIVLGAHGETSMREALIGSVAERVVRHASCSVLVVRDDAASIPD